VTFKSGLNVVLAERSEDSTKKDTRNSVGKSSLIEVINFCLGAGASKGKGLLDDHLSGWEFTLDLKFDDKKLSVSRLVDEPNRVYLGGELSVLPTAPAIDKETGTPYFKLADWNNVLGNCLFGLPVDGFKRKYAPTYRSLISYFIRRGRDAYSTPFEHYRKQLEWDKQVNNAYLLGLSWEDASDWQVIRDKKAVLDELKNAVKSGLMDEVTGGSIGELEAEKIALEGSIKEQQEALASFKVHPQYREIEQQANQLTREILKLTNRAVELRRLISDYEESIREVPEVNVDDVVSLYQEVGVAFPEGTKRHLEEAKDFHIRVIRNRKNFLKAEMERLQSSLEEAEAVRRAKTDERAGLLGILRETKALDEFTRLQELLTGRQAQLKEVEMKIRTKRQIEEGTSVLRIEEEQLKRRARLDLDERSELRTRAIRIFNSNSERLYHVPGILVIDLKQSGFTFDVQIKGSGSTGIDSMKVFCYDLTLAELWSTRKPSPGFLIHDSIMFDPVDERQRAIALEMAAEKSEQHHYQYICTINSDMLPRAEFSPSFDIDQHVVLTLTDTKPEGSLFGFRY
jgi:uncharacterized protein YydD (DUF2326 family)